MGAKWDNGEVAFNPEFWSDVLRVMKPGAHLLAFGGTKTFHRLVGAIEDAGFEVRDCISWLYGTGFNKKGYIKNADGTHAMHGWGGALKPAMELICLARKPLGGRTVADNMLTHGVGAINIDACRVEGINNGERVWENGRKGSKYTTATKTEGRAGRWPSNVLHDGSPEVVEAFPDTATASAGKPRTGKNGNGYGMTHTGAEYDDNGGSAARFFKTFQPTEDKQWQLQECKTEHVRNAKKCLNLQSEAVVSALSSAVDMSEGGLTLQIASYRAPSIAVTVNEFERIETLVTEMTMNLERRYSQGLRREKLTLSSNLASIAATPNPTGTTTITISLLKSNGFVEPVTFNITPSLWALPLFVRAKRVFYTSKAGADDRLGSSHPTIKPLDLMQYLCRLVTPKGGTVLDPFAGTGTTGEAAFREGFNAVLIEREPEYQADIRRRMSLVLGGPEERRNSSLKAKGLVEDAGPLFGGTIGAVRINDSAKRAGVEG
jgi:DNA modification methylase